MQRQLDNGVFFEFAKLLNSIRLANIRLHFLRFFLNNLPFCRFFGCFRRRFSRIFRCGATFCNKSVKCLRRHIFSARLHFPIRIFLPLKTFQPFILWLNSLFLKKIFLNGLHSKPFRNEGFRGGTKHRLFYVRADATYKTFFISSEQFFSFCLIVFPLR